MQHIEAQLPLVTHCYDTLVLVLSSLLPDQFFLLVIREE